MKANRSPRIAIIGAGFAGLCMAIQLKKAGIHSFTIYEKAAGVGGTWFANTYPGVACDIPSDLYSFSFEPNPNWTRAFSQGAEIQAYCEHCVRKYRLHAHLQFGAQLTHAKYTAAGWQLTFADQTTITADYLISGMGGLHKPSVPQIAGQATFAGTQFHSANWQHDHDLTGRRVAVIGSAASAVQIVPNIAQQVAKLCVFQRTPNWITPRKDRACSPARQARFRRMPMLQKLRRLRLYSLFEMRFPLFLQRKIFIHFATKIALRHLRRQVSNVQLRDKLTPRYPIGCKRILVSDDFYPALALDQVKLVTAKITQLEPNAVVTEDGEKHVVDTIVYATGFKPFSIIDEVEIQGEQGQSMRDYYAAGVRAHRTVALPGFPNFFMILGPNSGLGHSSIILIIETQVRYIVNVLKRMSDLGAKQIQARADAANKFDQMIQHKMQDTVWMGNCQSWYQDKTGRIYTLWPRSTLSFMRALRHFDEDEYSIVG